MATLLNITSSLFSDQGQSSQLAKQFIQQWREANKDGRVVHRDLNANPLPHLTAERFQAFSTKVQDRTDAQHHHVAVSDALIEELKQADTVVIGMPMYNFGIPSTLKAWIDHVGRAGVTFKYTDKGPVGLVDDKKVVIFATRGGRYLGTAQDSQSPYIKTFLNFIGLHDIEIVYAEGLASSGEQQQQTIADAAQRGQSILNALETAAA